MGQSLHLANLQQTRSSLDRVDRAEQVVDEQYRVGGPLQLDQPVANLGQVLARLLAEIAGQADLVRRNL